MKDINKENLQKEADAELSRQHLHELFQQSAERADQLEAVFEAITDGVFLLDAPGILSRMNRAGRKMLAIPANTPAESMHNFPFDLLDEQGRPLPRDQWPEARLLRGERIQGANAVDVLLQTHNGRKRYLSVTGSPLHNSEGKVIGAVMVCRDVTGRRHWEQNTRQALSGLLEMTQVLATGNETTFNEEKPAEQTKDAIRRVAQRLAELTCNVLECERLSIIAIDPDTGLMHPLGLIGLTSEQEKQWWAEQEGHRSRFTDSPHQSLVQRLVAGEVLLLDMMQPPWNETPNPYGIGTMLVAPMSFGDHLVGLITLDYGGAEHMYTEEELSIAGAAAKFAAAVIERERLLRQREELRASEIALRNANQQMADLIALAHDAIIVRNPQGVILSWNQGAEKLYGWTAQQAIGQFIHTLLQTRFPQSYEAIEAMLKRNGQWEGQLIHTRYDGAQVVVDSRKVEVQDEEGKPTAVLEINRDISEVEQLTREQAEAYARELSLRETKERMDEFLGIASHELRTPLTTIKGNIQLARHRMKHVIRLLLKNGNFSESDLEEIQMMLDRAERQVNVQNRLIRDLLDITHIQVSKLDLNMELYDLTTIVRETVADICSSAPKRALRVVLDESEENPIIADAERISQVVSNYLTNALKYSPADRPIEVRLERTRNNMARVSVRDEGPGLTPVEQMRVWERFYQVHGVERQKGFSSGLGLGLHICQAIIDEHQGEVGVESTRGAGSTFWFTLPLAEPAPRAQEEALPSADFTL